MFFFYSSATNNIACIWGGRGRGRLTGLRILGTGGRAMARERIRDAGMAGGEGGRGGGDNWGDEIFRVKTYRRTRRVQGEYRYSRISPSVAHFHAHRPSPHSTTPCMHTPCPAYSHSHTRTRIISSSTPASIMTHAHSPPLAWATSSLARATSPAQATFSARATSSAQADGGRHSGPEALTANPV